MATDNKKSFNRRFFVSTVLLFSFILAAFSGVALYLRPEGSLARWLGWHFLWLQKSAWENLHILAVALFVIFSLFHLFLNYKILWGYLKKKQSGALSGFKELLLAIMLIFFIVFSAFSSFSPLNKLVGLRQDLKGSKYSETEKPPFADADRLTLEDLANKLGRDFFQLKKRSEAFKLKGFKADKSLAEFARQNGMSPQQAYRLLFQ